MFCWCNMKNPCHLHPWLGSPWHLWAMDFLCFVALSLQVYLSQEIFCILRPIDYVENTWKHPILETNHLRLVCTCNNGDHWVPHIVVTSCFQYCSYWYRPTSWCPKIHIAFHHPFDPIYIASGKSKPSRILKAIQVFKLCLKIVHYDVTSKFHDLSSFSYQDDRFCVSRSVWWSWTAINAC